MLQLFNDLFILEEQTKERRKFIQGKTMAVKTQRHANRFKLQLVTAAVLTALTGVSTFAAEDEEEENKEENKVVVTGSQIKGTFAKDALAVTTLSAEEIEFLGVDTGEELMDLVPENGNNFFNETDTAGGVNAARGDTGAFNLRNLGTGNSLILFNGRRMVNSATFQTEEVGGSFVPVNSANSNVMPVHAMDRLEILRDGASAIYGADAVAGVVNYVMKSNFTGFDVRYRHENWESIPRKRDRINIDWGQDFNDGKTNLSVFFTYDERNRVNAQDDPRWANSDFRSRLPEDSPWASLTSFRNNSANDAFGQFDIVPSAPSSVRGFLTDSAGDMEVFPLGDPRCVTPINEYICSGLDGAGLSRYNLNAVRDLSSAMERYNIYSSLNHQLGDGMESFTEFSYYKSNTRRASSPSAMLNSSFDFTVGAANYWNPLGPCGSPNRIVPCEADGSDVPDEGVAWRMENYRFTDDPRVINNQGTTLRLLTGLRGNWDDWDWEGAILYARSDKDDVTNRISNSLMEEALNDPTSAAYNPFCGGCAESNVERAVVEVFRKSQASLTSIDFKMSHPALFELWGGDAGFLAGVEIRNEDFEDDRDPRLDGTITYTNRAGETFPLASDVANSSPTSDSSGERDVTSLFAELQLPVLENLDVQAAIRYEDFSDVESTTVGKLAFGYRPIDEIMIRGSWSEAFRAPNLITINESLVVRNNTRRDYLCTYATDVAVAGGADPEDVEDLIGDCSNAVQRTAQGSRDLKPETSENTSYGLVLAPIDNLTITVDWWKIEKDDTIGLFGEENHTILELVNSLQAGNANCGQSFNPAVVRSDDPLDPEVTALYNAAGICPAGDLIRINDVYANLDTRILEGHDITFNYTLETDSFGTWDFRYQVANLDRYEQQAGGDSLVLVEAQESGLIPPNVPVDGFADLLNRDGNQDKRDNMRLSWRMGKFTTALTGHRIGAFYDSSDTLADGTRYVIPSMTRYNLSVRYRHEDTSVRIGINNIRDERAPLADASFGFNSDAHNDYGRSIYVDIRHSFY